MSVRIQESTHYDCFELLQFNRDVHKTTNLERSMRKYGWLDPYPMHVVENGNGKYKIKGGHHRFFVARKLGIPVKFVVSGDDGGVTIHELERATTKWTMDDYLISYVKCGFGDYIVVNEYHRRTGISLKHCIAFLAGEAVGGGGNKSESFKAGTYRVTGTEHAENMAGVIRNMQDAGIEWATNAIFVGALSRIVLTPECNLDRLKHKLVQHKAWLNKQPNKHAYTSMIEDVYNRQTQGPGRVPLSHLADEHMRSRNAVEKMIRQKRDRDGTKGTA